jgi:CPA1 family monovalent cation:H+ antiporter
LDKKLSEVALGLGIGYIGYKLIASTDNYQVEVLITLAIVMGVTLCSFHTCFWTSAMVAAGLITGNQGKKIRNVRRNC